MLLKKKSKIHRFGIFSTEKIKKGESFYKLPLDNIVNSSRKKCAYIGDGKWVCDCKVLN